MLSQLADKARFAVLPNLHSAKTLSAARWHGALPRSCNGIALGAGGVAMYNYAMIVRRSSEPRLN